MPAMNKKAKEKKRLKRLIEAQLNQTHRHWTGTGLKIRRNQFSLRPDQRVHVQGIGKVHGCHTCRTKLESDKNQPWVGDHIPPTNLSSSAKLAQKCRKEVYLFPSCHSCSNQQAALVRQLKNNPTKKLTARERKMIHGGRKSDRGIRTYGTKVSVYEGVLIQDLGEREGCHICGTKYPVDTYISDHTFPQELCTTYMEQVFDLLDLDYPTQFELRPQCTRCSSNQGGKVLQVRMLAMKFARENGITVYKY